MCQIFAGQDPATYAYVARSVRLAGHATSIRLEAAFWDILDEIAQRQNLTTPRFLSTLYDEAMQLHGKVSNFSSLLRVTCVLYLRRPDLLAGLIAAADEAIPMAASKQPKPESPSAPAATKVDVVTGYHQRLAPGV